ncbi:MAG: peptide chain release factor N(5)-glutamine methyltransferase [Candidatus Eremiobacteraeota bacterium]|nr:peptide chain release factor N(5)-glutamine methyltransferase [Candidatus Eremiobacteraeota bacterium]
MSSTIAEVLQKGKKFLGRSASSTPELDAEVLLSAAMALSRTELYVHFDRIVKVLEIEKYGAMLEKRMEGFPVSYLTGRREFMSLVFQLDATCLIPRAETELLVEKVMAWLEKQDIPSPRVLEFGTGSGCIACALARFLPPVTITATDISGGALAMAEKNAVSLGVAPRIRFTRGDLYDAIGSDEPFDVIVSNPPYVTHQEFTELPRSVREFEPVMALRADEGGLSISRRIIEGSALWLKSRGLMALEINPALGRDLVELLAGNGFHRCEVHDDLAGFPRVITAEKR